MTLFTYSPVFLQRTSQLSRQPPLTAVSEEVICVPGTHCIERLTYSLHQHLSRPDPDNDVSSTCFTCGALMRKRFPKAIRLRRKKCNATEAKRPDVSTPFVHQCT